MQVNDLVKVSAETNQFVGGAGIVLACVEGVNTVKLDLVDEPQDFADDELMFLGR